MDKWFCPFYRCTVFLCMTIPPFISVLTSRMNTWTACNLGLLYILLLYHLHVSFYMIICFHFSWVDSYLSLTAGSYGRNMSNFLRNCFSKWLDHFTYPPAMYEGSNLSTDSLTLGIINLIDGSHSNGCDCYFNLHFPDYY